MTKNGSNVKKKTNFFGFIIIKYKFNAKNFSSLNK